jgi:hypothetical protein
MSGLTLGVWTPQRADGTRRGPAQRLPGERQASESAAPSDEGGDGPLHQTKERAGCGIDTHE